MKIKRDTKGQPYIEWEQAKDIYKRAWIQDRRGEQDWAGTRWYLNVVRCDERRNPDGIPADFPLYNKKYNKKLSDEQILLAFVYATNAITGVPGWDKLT